jgi:hypothetical protein
MGDNSSGSWYFCYLTISNQTELIIQSVLVSLSLLLIGDAFRKFWKMRATHNSDVSFIYRLILVWWSSTKALTQLIYCPTPSDSRSSLLRIINPQIIPTSSTARPPSTTSSWTG